MYLTANMKLKLEIAGINTRVCNNQYVSILIDRNFYVIYLSRYPAKVNLHSPNLPTKYPDKERQAYSATRDDPANLTTLKPHLA